MIAMLRERLIALVKYLASFWICHLLGIAVIATVNNPLVVNIAAQSRALARLGPDLHERFLLPGRSAGGSHANTDANSERAKDFYVAPHRTACRARAALAE